jgi:hypothetical protein
MANTSMLKLEKNIAEATRRKKAEITSINGTMMVRLTLSRTSDCHSQSIIERLGYRQGDAGSEFGRYSH